MISRFLNAFFLLIVQIFLFCCFFVFVNPTQVDERFEFMIENYLNIHCRKKRKPGKSLEFKKITLNNSCASYLYLCTVCTVEMRFYGSFVLKNIVSRSGVGGPVSPADHPGQDRQGLPLLQPDERLLSGSF